jgi:hypothetical protein
MKLEFCSPIYLPAWCVEGQLYFYLIFIEIPDIVIVLCLLKFNIILLKKMFHDCCILCSLSDINDLIFTCLHMLMATSMSLLLVTSDHQNSKSVSCWYILCCTSVEL